MSGPLIMLLICGLGFIGIVWALKASKPDTETPEDLARDSVLQQRYSRLLKEWMNARWAVDDLEIKQKVNYLPSRARKLKSERQRVRRLSKEIDRMSGRWL